MASCLDSNLENPPNLTQLHEDFIRKVGAWEAKKAWLEEHRTVDMSFIKKMNALSTAVDNLGRKMKKVNNHAILYPDIDLIRKKVWLGMARIKKAIKTTSLFEITSSTMSVLDIEEKAEANKDNSTKNNDVATIDNNAVEKNFEIEPDADSLEEIANIETTENPTETTTDEDIEEKVEDKEENKRTETNSTASNFEIENAVESLKENGDVAADLEKGTDDPVKEETKENYEIEQAVDPLNAISDEEHTDVIKDLDFVGNKLIEEKKEPGAKPDDVARVGSLIPRKAAENDMLKDEEHEAEVEQISDATLKNVPFPFDPGIEIDATEDTHNLEVQAEEKETTEDDSESQDVSEESLDFQPDAPSVVVCCYCRNTSPSIVQYFTTRKARTADLNETDTSAPSDFILFIITEEVEAIDDTVEAEEIVDAREVHEDILEAMREGTKGEENDDRYKA